MLPIWHMNGSVLSFSLHLAGFFARWMGFRVSYSTLSSKKQLTSNVINDTRMASTLFTTCSWLPCTWISQFLYNAPSSSKKCWRMLPMRNTNGFYLFLLRLASFLVSAMGFPAECCTFLFKEITCSDFYQHRTPNGFVFFSVFSVPSCKWDCFHCWMVYKEKLTVHSVSWTHEGFSSWYFSECRSCSVVLFPRYTRKYSPAVHTNWLSFWQGFILVS